MNSASLERGRGLKKTEILSAFLGLAARFNNGRAVGWMDWQARCIAQERLGRASCGIWEMRAVECVGFAAISLC